MNVELEYSKTVTKTQIRNLWKIFK